MRIAAPIVALALAASIGVARAGSSPPPPTVPCDSINVTAKSGSDNGWRVVLGVVSVPPAHLGQVVSTHEQPWAFWRKAGLAIRGGRGPVVSVSVPKPWRKRAAITWGDNTGIVSSIRFARCPIQLPYNVWNGYAGGFSLRSRSVVRAADRSRRPAHHNRALRHRPNMRLVTPSLEHPLATALGASNSWERASHAVRPRECMVTKGLEVPTRNPSRSSPSVGTATALAGACRTGERSRRVFGGRPGCMARSGIR